MSNLGLGQGKHAPGALARAMATSGYVLPANPHVMACPKPAGRPSASRPHRCPRTRVARLIVRVMVMVAHALWWPCLAGSEHFRDRIRPTPPAGRSTPDTAAKYFSKTHFLPSAKSRAKALEISKIEVRKCVTSRSEIGKRMPHTSNRQRFPENVLLEQRKDDGQVAGNGAGHGRRSAETGSGMAH